MAWIIVPSILLILFLAMIVIGFNRIRHPDSGTLLIVGFLGLGCSVYFLQISSHMLGEFLVAGLIDFSTLSKLNNLLLYGMFIPILCPLVLAIIGFANRSHPASRHFKLIGAVGVLFAFWFAPSWIKAPDKSAEAEIKANSHTIQIELERYSFDNNRFYPESIEVLKNEGYLTDYPWNPFASQPMKNVPYGSPDFEGNFTYLPVTVDDEIRGYYLIAYGYRDNSGLRLVDKDVADHVIVVINQGEWLPAVPFPDIKDVIQSTVMTEF